MLWPRCSNVVTTSWKRREATLSQCRKPTAEQLSFSTVSQRCDNINNDVATMLSQRRCASWESCYFFGITTLPDLSVLLSSYFFQNSNFLPGRYLLRIYSSLGRLLFRRTNLFRIKIEELLFRSRYFYTVSKQNSYFFNKANSSKEVTFKKSCFLRETTFLNQLIFQKSNIPQLTLTQLVLLHS